MFTIPLDAQGPVADEDSKDNNDKKEDKEEDKKEGKEGDQGWLFRQMNVPHNQASIVAKPPMVTIAMTIA